MVPIPMVRSWNREISPFLSIFGLQRSGPKGPFVKQSRDSVMSQRGGEPTILVLRVYGNMVYLPIREWLCFNGFDEG